MVLLVEDDPPVMLYLAYALRHLGFGVTECENVGLALEAFSLQTPTLILTDCNLPGRSGTQLIEIVLAAHPTMIIIGMSAEHHKGSAMLAAGATAFY